MNPFVLRLRTEEHSLALCYPLTAALIVVAGTAATLALDQLVTHAYPALASLWPSLAALCLVGMVFNVMWLVWWSTVEFDRVRDRVRLGSWITVGRVSAIQAIECGASRRAPLCVVFRDPSGTVRRWPITGVRMSQAAALGALLAATLNVPFS